MKFVDFSAADRKKNISPQGTFDGSMKLRCAESNGVTIVPGAFVRREYLSTMPNSITGGS